MRRPNPVTIAFTSAVLLFAAFLLAGCPTPPNVNVNTNSGLVTGTPTPAPTPINCTASPTPTDQQLVDRVYAMLAYKNPEYMKQAWQFNITVNPVDKAVTITGWSSLDTQIKTDAETALKNCKPINVDNFVSARSALNPQFRVGCPPDYAPCGDICVRTGEPCKLTSELQSAPGNAPVCVRPTPTPTPGKPAKAP